MMLNRKPSSKRSSCQDAGSSIVSRADYAEHLNSLLPHTKEAGEIYSLEGVGDIYQHQPVSAEGDWHVKDRYVLVGLVLVKYRTGG
jgi:hypothetical protein